MFNYKNLIIAAAIIIAMVIIGFAISWLTVAIGIGCFVAGAGVLAFVVHNNPARFAWLINFMAKKA